MPGHCLGSISSGQLIKVPFKPVAQRRHRRHLLRAPPDRGIVASENRLGPRRGVAPPFIEFGALMHQAGRLIRLHGAPMRGKDIVGQISEIQISLVLQSL